MSIRKVGITVGLCLSLCASASGMAAELKKVTPEAQGFSSERLERLTAKLHGYVDEGKLPGFVAMVARKGEVVYSDSYGFQNIKDQTPIQQDSLFRIYSMTKAVVSVAALTLYEQGKFHLHDPVAKYIPAFKNLKVYVSGEGDEMVTEALERPLTIQHLFTHTSGFTYHFIGDTPVHKLYREIGIMPSASLLGARETDHAPSSSLDEFVERLSQVPLLHQPGAKFSYGVSVDVLAYLVEQWSGMPIEAYLEKTLFKPLDMRDTSYEVDDSDDARFMNNYDITPTGLILKPDNAPNPYTEPAHLNGGGAGLVSTARDYIRFTQMIVGGGALGGARILSPGTVDLMRSNHVPRTVESPELQDFGFGLGFAIHLDPARNGVLVPQNTFFWSGAASTYFWVDPVNDISVVLMTQVMPSIFPLPNDLRALVYQALVNP